MAMKRTRRMRLCNVSATAETRWTNPTITLATWKNGSRHEAVITIESPWQLREIRSELEKIAAYWRNEAAR